MLPPLPLSSLPTASAVEMSGSMAQAEILTTEESTLPLLPTPLTSVEVEGARVSEMEAAVAPRADPTR